MPTHRQLLRQEISRLSRLLRCLLFIRYLRRLLFFAAFCTQTGKDLFFLPVFFRQIGHILFQISTLLKQLPLFFLPVPGFSPKSLFRVFQPLFQTLQRAVYIYIRASGLTETGSIIFQRPGKFLSRRGGKLSDGNRAVIEGRCHSA